MDPPIFAEAAKLAARYFQPDIAATIRRFIAGNYGLAEAILHELPVNHSDPSVAEGIPHFCTMTSGIFTPEYRRGLIERATAFDDFCRESSVTGDEDGISNVFIQEKPIVCWVVEIVKVIAADCESTAEGRNATVQQCGNEGPHASNSVLTRELLPTDLASGPVIDDVRPEDASTDVQPPTTRLPCPIIQIDLQGTNIWQAWRNNPITRDMEAAATPRMIGGESWSPSSSRTLPVYHGTSNNLTSAQYHADYTILEAGRSSPSSFRGLEGHVNPNQVVPSDRRLPVVWTGFSPLRCFVWATWRADVIGDLRLGGNAMRKLSHRWECGDHEHTGVCLYEFRPFPAPDTTQYIMPKGQEQAWHDRRRTIETERIFRQADSTNALWALFSAFHHNDPSAWPEALHCKEFGLQRNQLEPHVKQLWRTVWFGQGIETVNRSHRASFAISMQLVQMTPIKQEPLKVIPHNSSDGQDPNTKPGSLR
ncbi:hypothetical protein FALBO_4627 [Fusarium albosuccineum]|uniref:Uncharacterized protein n=1 Tax=Fusarium albosuccineum TaxID=1237068 RepID=A0A8H4PAL5_9HYPO|nr:hypothetical protein FALBO_4627 [Fusarium albosuccineum]KAF5010971.1 hypothetical protein FDECE_2881 [Fusarium decemcellulare]